MATKLQLRISKLIKRFRKIDAHSTLGIADICTKCGEDSVVRFDGDDLCIPCAEKLLVKLNNMVRNGS